jgi:hypothetical protein
MCRCKCLCNCSGNLKNLSMLMNISWKSDYEVDGFMGNNILNHNFANVKARKTFVESMFNGDGCMYVMWYLGLS